ncbi:hypothetical protein HCH_05421 [Hahella chejuensis KCTC 2396]|uniref:Uncharacterized protein n=1 Tax=Hahella chejuensis (strain KCTC 2396) TaxID=349521 RepID=Q2SB87_HAHCH|nr:hypothetical protein HCH_05421 [Hahella chejuensis KCTC 2396]
MMAVGVRRLKVPLRLPAVWITLFLDGEIRLQQVHLQANGFARILQGMIGVLFKIHRIQWRAIGNVPQSNGVFEDLQVFVVHLIDLGVEILGEEAVQTFFRRRNPVGAAHGEAQHKGFIFRRHASPQQDVDIIMRFQSGGAVEQIDAGDVKFGILHQLDNQRDVFLFQSDALDAGECFRHSHLVIVQLDVPFCHAFG